MKLIFDCGSTKTSIAIISSVKLSIHSDIAAGFNAVTGNSDDLVSIIKSCGNLADISNDIEDIRYYGAGCATDEAMERVNHGLERMFPKAMIHIHSDMLGAARSVCGKDKGIVGILGTGSNSCVYDGEKITANISPLGYVLGDEGSGAVLGRLFLGKLLKNRFPDSVKKDFFDTYRLSIADIITQVYRSPRPNAFLASFAPFISKHTSCNEIQDFLIEEFTRFVTYNLSNYHEFPELPVNLVGSIALHFQTYIEEAIRRQGGKIGNVTNSPIEGLARYHSVKD